jgi:RhoGAP (GTPase activating protein)-like protein
LILTLPSRLYFSRCRHVLYAVLEVLHAVSANSDSNKMTASNLAVCIGPNFVRTVDPDPIRATTELKKFQDVVTMCDLLCDNLLL